MKRILPLLLTTATTLLATDIDLQPDRDSLWKAQYGNKPAHWLTKEEALKREEYRKNYVVPQTRSVPTAPRSIAEFEQMEAIIVSYPGEFGFEVNLIEELSKEIKVYILASASYHSSVNQILKSANVTMSNIEIIDAKVDSYWTRDYGPWCIAEGSEKISIVNFKYNRPRPNDDKVPTLIADKLGMSSYYMDLEQCGGNYMSNGLGEAVATELVVEENSSKGESGVRSLMEEYLGIDEYHITIDPLGEYIKHVDCWGKYLGPDKILIAEVSGSKKAAYDEVAEQFRNLTSPYGTPYKVYRIYTDGEPYTNSTIVNNKVFVPIQGTGNDEAALQVYRDAMPGYEVIGISNNGYNPWMSTDALHCRTKGIADRQMLHVNHTPLHDTISFIGGEEKTLSFTLTPYSKQGINLDSTFLFIRKDFEKSYTQIPLAQTSTFEYEASFSYDEYKGVIAIEYYLEAVDSAGKRAQFPLMGEDDPVRFFGKNDAIAIGQKNESTYTSFSVSQQQNSISISSSERGVFTLYSLKGRKIMQKRVSGQEVATLSKELLPTSCLLYQFTSERGNRLSAGKLFIK